MANYHLSLMSMPHNLCFVMAAFYIWYQCLYWQVLLYSCITFNQQHCHLQCLAFLSCFHVWQCVVTLQSSTGLIFARFWCRMQYCFTCLLALGTSMKECILHMMCPQSRRWKNWGGERKQWQTLFCPPSIGQKNYLAKEKVCGK